MTATATETLLRGSDQRLRMDWAYAEATERIAEFTAKAWTALDRRWASLGRGLPMSEGSELASGVQVRLRRYGRRASVGSPGVRAWMPSMALGSSVLKAPQNLQMHRAAPRASGKRQAGSGG